MLVEKHEHLRQLKASFNDTFVAHLCQEIYQSIVDEQQSQRELERIADYRNYHRYEMYKEVEGKPPIALSEYGTGSGGQLETPAYIIRG